MISSLACWSLVTYLTLAYFIKKISLFFIPYLSSLESQHSIHIPHTMGLIKKYNDKQYSLPLTSSINTCWKTAKPLPKRKENVSYAMTPVYDQYKGIHSFTHYIYRVPPMAKHQTRHRGDDSKQNKPLSLLSWSNRYWSNNYTDMQTAVVTNVRKRHKML